MNCKFHKNIEDYHDGNLQHKQLHWIEAHLENCPNCQLHLLELREKEQMINRFRSVSPELSNPSQFREEILDRIGPRSQSKKQPDIQRIVDVMVYFLLQPTTRYAFVSAAVLIFSLFVYQHYVLVEKIDALSDKMETNIRYEENQRKNRYELLSNYQEQESMTMEEVEDLIHDYRLLQIRYRAVIKVLKSKHPEVYYELQNILDEDQEELVRQTQKTL